MFKRFFAVLVARNLEFFRDRSALGWNLAFPILLVVGFAFIFKNDNPTLFKIGYVGDLQQHSISQYKHLEFIEYQDKSVAIEKLRQHKLDLLVSFDAKQYWVNSSSANGYIAEKLLLAETTQATAQFVKEAIEGQEIRYLDWVVPGILAMNMMFSCLYGVGYVIVRYRKNAVLKRLSATPLKPVEFLAAQIVSRLLIVVALTSAIFVACHLIFDFYLIGSMLWLLVLCVLGAFSLISLSLLIACRSESEEFTGGILNLVSWPMMMLSGVWFSLEGSPAFVQAISQVFPLTQMLIGARAVMLEGAGFVEIAPQLFILIGQSVVFLLLGALFFSWKGQTR
ncbi:Inner membrane transport permease YhhJ [Pseudoalteromonas sp. P1-9]|uniref:ABC transporter permease n=1 Tax=Pseudoalteromonas sp. P1-9 TaxID=1710354 RepID=UPI0006D5EC99|nr:ABC transporter permease [Pseudoalteromonas sp. P1-9]KPV95408.1 Inner membrane transport permease YhhJ [Pseudoalteromonas sp. P1-9]